MFKVLVTHGYRLLLLPETLKTKKTSISYDHPFKCNILTPNFYTFYFIKKKSTDSLSFIKKKIPSSRAVKILSLWSVFQHFRAPRPDDLPSFQL